MPEQYKRKPNTSCTVCKKPLYRRPLVLQKNGNKAFCSLTCYGLSTRKEHPCIVCGKPILSQFNKKTCSRACANTNRSGTQYRVGRPNDKAVKDRALKIKLLKLRGGQCERCGYSTREILQVHHKNRNHSDNRVTNLELICPNCHCKEHYFNNSWLKKYTK